MINSTYDNIFLQNIILSNDSTIKYNDQSSIRNNNGNIEFKHMNNNYNVLGSDWSGTTSIFNTFVQTWNLNEKKTFNLLKLSFSCEKYIVSIFEYVSSVASDGAYDCTNDYIIDFQSSIIYITKLSSGNVVNGVVVSCISV